MNLTPNEIKVLSVLYADMDGEHFGLSIGKETKLSIGVLYPVLDKLQDDGLIDVKWQEKKEKDRRPRLLYFLSGKGIKAYEQEKASNPKGVGVEYV